MDSAEYPDWTGHLMVIGTCLTCESQLATSETQYWLSRGCFEVAFPLLKAQQGESPGVQGSRDESFHNWRGDSRNAFNKIVTAMKIQLFTLAALLMSGLPTLAQQSLPSFILQKDDLIHLDIRLAADKSAEVSFKIKEPLAASFREFAERHAGKEVVIEVMKTKLSRFMTQDLSDTEVHTFTNVAPTDAVHLAEAFARMDFARTFKSLEAAQRIKVSSGPGYILQGPSLVEAVRELAEESVRQDPEREGVRFIVVGGADASQSDRPVSIDISGRTIAEAARIIADAAGHVLSVEDHALVFRPRHTTPRS